MTGLVLAALPFSWTLAYAITAVVTLVVVALVLTVVLQAFSIAHEALLINGPLKEAVVNTAPLIELNKTIENAEVIVDGLYRGRKRLGG
jgi:hypothetical protein